MMRAKGHKIELCAALGYTFQNNKILRLMVCAFTTQKRLLGPTQLGYRTMMAARLHNCTRDIVVVYVQNCHLSGREFSSLKCLREVCSLVLSDV